ncbi:MAG: hypothetical protein M3137_14130, partial [Actinomycetota bacterium]|nr:hypothetical protein [Actinomycetota bacterium]
IGVDSCRHVRGRSELLLGVLPLILGVHQLTEDFVWWGLQGHVAHEIGRIAVWAYLLIAFAVIPVFVPMAVLVLEPTSRRRWRMAPFLCIGVLVSMVLLAAMAHGPVHAAIRPWHLSYHVQLHHGGVVVGLYVVAICGALLFSGYRHIVIFGMTNVVVVIALATLLVGGFISLWCVYAAVSAGAIALHLRYAEARRPPLAGT